MFELIVRTVLAIAVLVVSGMGGPLPFDTTWRVSAFFAAYSFLAFVMEKRDLRNPGVSGLVAVADSAVVAYVLAAAGRMETFGFLCLIPPAWAVLRFGADAMAMAPIVVAWLLIGSNLFGGKGWTPVLLSQSAGILVIGLLGVRRERVVKVTELIEVPTDGPLPAQVPHEYYDLRDKFRTLRDHASELERKGRRDRWAVQLAEAVESEGEPSLTALAKKVQELCDVDGLTLYAFSQTTDRLVVHGVAGDVPASAKDTAFEIPEFLGEWQLKERLTSAVQAIKSPENVAHSGTVLLKNRGRIVGMLALFDASKAKLADACDSVKDSAEAIAKIIRLQLQRDDEKRRLRQAEILYNVAATSQGADDPASLASRICRELWETLRLDHLSIGFVEGQELVIAASQGANFKFLDSVPFGQEKGFAGWLQAGGPEVVMLDARDDERFPREEALKKRIGSVVLVPLAFSEEVYGYMSIGSHRVHGIDSSTLEILRIVAAEFSHALGRIVNGHREPDGLATPSEFHSCIKEAKQGIMVYLEVLRRDELTETHGRPAMEFAARKLATRLRALLPSGSVMCRRIEGDFVVFLRTQDEEFARAWASNAAATASMVALTTPDGTSRLPLAVRAKVALLSPQQDQISRVGAA